jgi:hypothetical protein
MSSRRSAALLASIALTAPALAQTTPFVRLRDQEIRCLPVSGPAWSPTSAQSALSTICSNVAVAWHNQAAPGGGTLAPLAFANPATLDGAGRSLFFAQVTGVARNQGIFAADAGGLQALVLGCGSGGGTGSSCSVGDPSPIGGNFSGFFGGTVFAPATNAGGDALFVADVSGGSSPRGLFLYRRASATVIKIAAVGEASPAGGTFGGVGPGSINDAGDVVFLAMGATLANTQLMRWSSGVLSKLAAVGDPAPLGGTYTNVGGEFFGFPDGTNIPVGPLPDINSDGSICFRALSSGPVSRGFVVVIAGVPQWYVAAGDATPAGGTYFDFAGANLNDAGEIAFYADYKPTPTTFSGAWFAGKPGNWRKVLGFSDAVDGGTCNGLAFSRNPMRALADDGSVLLWTNVNHGGVDKETELVIDAAGGQTVIARQGDPTPKGGTYTSMDAWPSFDGLRGTLGAGTPGASGGALNTHFAFALCAPPPVIYCTAKLNSLGCTPSIGASGTASASAASGFTVSCTQLVNNKLGMLIYGLDGRAATPFAGGVLCVASPLRRTPVGATGGNPPPNDCSGSLSIDMNAFAAGALGGSPHAALKIPGSVVDAQFWSRDPGFPPPNSVSLSAGVEYVVGI